MRTCVAHRAAQIAGQQNRAEDRRLRNRVKDRACKFDDCQVPIDDRQVPADMIEVLLQRRLSS